MKCVRGVVTRGRARLLPVFAVVVLTLAWPTAAQADISVTASGTIVTVTGNDESNSVWAVATRTGADIVVRNGESAAASDSCAVQSAGVVRCSLGAPMTRMVADLPGPLADAFEKAIFSPEPDFAWDLDLDFGEADGADTVDLGAPGNDRVDGGPGTRDVVSYFSCACASGVSIRLDGAASDDTLLGVEMVRGSLGPDRLIGSDEPLPPNATFDAEFLDGRSGNDVITGNGGGDALIGGEGDDTILAVDGETDSIDCGPGVDRAEVDAIDGFAFRSDCEVVAVGGDRDGDGLPDDWEVNGYDPNGDGVPEVDLKAMGANPDRKDIFVEVDFMTGHQLDQETLALVIDAFSNAPVASLNGAPSGIALHVDNGANSVMNPVTREGWGPLSNQNELAHVEVLGTEDAGGDYNWGAFDQIRSSGLLVNRRPIFHYVVSAHNGPDSFAGISRGIEASDLLLTLGGDGAAETPRSREFIADTFMHELGHNLGLRHGGADDINRKPNYLSIMSYGHGGAGIIRADGTPVIDYSRFAIPLNENLLDEVQGFGLAAGSPPTAFRTFYTCAGDKVKAALLTSPIDWNCDGTIFPAAVSADVSGGNGTTDLAGQADWDKLVFDGGVIGNKTVPATTPNIEPTVEEIDARAVAVRAAIAEAAGAGSPPPPPLAPGPGVRPAPPRLSALRVAPGTLRTARRRGVKVAYRLNRAAAVTFTVQRRVGRNWIRVAGSFKQAGKAGPNTVRFSGRLAGKLLKPGRYRLVAVPRGGAPTRAQFTVRR